ncbi:ATP-binding protein [Streptomyces galbus]|uniref:ATP-binding protein n=1 Tax=Streptomyces galbus TaxID=33898 RepID=A0ABX1IHA6_STRGB|nr:ATP-binding protein [Streptomyces galbus]NKQ25010.1 ATP-binding protein [Streptomyces galbus]
MKQSAAKTLGVATLGAAFAAAGAGAANAAPALPDAAQTLDGVTRTLPTETVAQAVPGAGQALKQAQPAVGAGLTAVQPIAERLIAEGPTKPVAGLLGGLPLQGLPTHGLPVNGVPLG